MQLELFGNLALHMLQDDMEYCPYADADDPAPLPCWSDPYWYSANRWSEWMANYLQLFGLW